MLFGKAVIVTDTGVYRELPNNCVCKVRPERKLEDLARLMRKLASNVQLRKQIGEQPERHAKIHFSPDAFARRLLEFQANLASCSPALKLIDRTGKELQRMGASPKMAIVDTASRESALLVDGDCDPPILRTRK
jgi:hypothetical protein